MKKITVCIILALLMCLTMVFPVSAADYLGYYFDEAGFRGNFLSSIRTDSRISDYPYRCYYMINHSANGMVYYCVAFKTPSPIINDECYILNADSSDSYKYLSVYKAKLTSSFSYSGDRIRYSFTASGYYDNTGKFVNSPFSSSYSMNLYFPEYSNVDINLPENQTWYYFTPDISALQALITQAKTIQSNGYTSASWQALQTQITAAESLLSTTGYTQTQVDTQTSDLQAAINGLVVLPNIDGLIILLAEADTITDIGYTAPTWSRFTTARSSGHALVASSSYTQTEVTSTTNELSASMTSLAVAAIIPPPSTPRPLGYDLGTGDITGYLAPSVDIFYSYVISIKPVLITLFAIIFGIKIGPLVLRRIFRGLRR